jgi:hypothetical protein
LGTNFINSASTASPLPSAAIKIAVRTTINFYLLNYRKATMKNSIWAQYSIVLSPSQVSIGLHHQRPW